MEKERRKPLEGKAYGSIGHLPGSRLGPADRSCNPGQAALVLSRWRKGDEITVTEKLDGSNCSVAKLPPDPDSPGEGPAIAALTRAGYYACTSPYEQHHRFEEWVYSPPVAARFHALLDVGERACGEWLIQAHGTRYDLPHEPFVVFDIMRGRERVPYDEMVRRCAARGFTTPRLVHRGGVFPLDRAVEAIATSGHGALDPVEGVVYRLETRGKFNFLAKYVAHSKVDGCYFSPDPALTVWNTYPGSPR